MSQDVRLTWLCSHITVDETVPLGSDRRSLSPVQPINGGAAVRVFAGSQEIPPRGLQSAATLTSQHAGPYNVGGPDPTFVIKTPAGTVTPRIATGQSLTAQGLADLINQRAGTAVYAEVVRGRLTVRDQTLGPGSFVRVSGTEVDRFGFTLQRGAQGRTVYPAWGVSVGGPGEDPRIQFSAPVVSRGSFSVTYPTVLNRCRRCRGSRVENDFRSDPYGDIALVVDENLLAQTCLKALLTIRGSNPYFRDYGSTLAGRIGTKNLASVAGLLAEDVRQTLRGIQALQRQQARIQPISNKEKLADILAVDVVQDPTDPTALRVHIVVRNASRDPVSLSVLYSVAGVRALSGVLSI